MRPNHLTAIIGVVLLLVAGAGLGAIEEKPQASHTGALKFHVSFPLHNGSEGTAGSVSDGATVTTIINVNHPNITFLALKVIWRDNAPRLTSAATVSVQMADPNGTQVGTGSGSDGTTGFTINGGAQTNAPADYDLKANSLTQAWQKVLDANPSNSNGTGGWKITVSATRGGFHPLRKGSVDINLEMLNTTYQAEVKLVEAAK